MSIDQPPDERSISRSIELIGNSIYDAELHSLARKSAFPNEPTIVNLNAQINDIRRARTILRPSPTMGSTLTPNSVALIEYCPNRESWNEGTRYDLMLTDEHGCVQNELYRPRDNSGVQKEKIAFLGGSTVMGTGSRLPYLTIPALTEQYLRSKGKNVNCVNYGVAGMTSRDSLTQLIDVVLPQCPSHVVMYTGWNCAFNFELNKIMQLDQSYRYLGVHSALGSRQIEQLIHLSSIYDWKTQLYRSWRLGANEVLSHISNKCGIKVVTSLVNRWLSHDPTVNGENMRFALELVSSGDLQVLAKSAGFEYLRIMRIARDLCESASISFTGIFQPNLYWGPKIRTAREDQFIDQEPVEADSQLLFYQYLKNRKFDGWIHDLSGVFEKTKEQTYLDTGHLMPLGNVLVAERVSEILTKQNV